MSCLNNSATVILELSFLRKQESIAESLGFCLYRKPLDSGSSPNENMIKLLPGTRRKKVHAIINEMMVASLNDKRSA